MEAKFCPQCGTPRQGNFCGKCGFNFKVHEAASAVPVSGGSEVGATELSHRTLPNGLTMGDKFSPKTHCDNCGLKLAKDSKCKECGE